MITKETVHLISTLIWGIYGIVVGTIVGIYAINDIWGYLSIIVAISGNSAHLISMSYSKNGLKVQTEEKQP